MNKLDVLGFRLTDDSAKNMVKEAWKYIGNGSMNKICFVSSQILLEAGADEECKNWLETMDMTVFGETGVIPTTIGDYRERKKEVTEALFLTEFLKRVSRNKLKILLLTETEEQVQILQDYLLSVRENLIISSFAFGEIADADLINEINDAAPNVIISKLPSHYQMQLMAENAQFINADVWLGMLYEQSLTKKNMGLFSRMSNLLYRRIFRRKVNHYNQRDKDQDKTE